MARDVSEEVNRPQLDDVLDLLNRHRQRATYGAVGAVVDRPPTFLMSGRPRDHWHSWVVNQETGLPTGYSDDEMHPELRSSDEVLRLPEELEAWLRINRSKPPR
jgi:hypothetical protein